MQTDNPRYQGMQRSSHEADDAMQPYNELYHQLREYAREHPESVALWCFGIGFVLGWRLKPW
jgi:hypothetical protein